LPLRIALGQVRCATRGVARRSREPKADTVVRGLWRTVARLRLPALLAVTVESSRGIDAHTEYRKFRGDPFEFFERGVSVDR